MQPRSTRTSANCCTSRTPPSPEGEPPRPALSPSKSSHQQGKAIISSSSTVATEAAELRQIFDENGERDKDSESVKEGKPQKLKTLLGEKSETDDNPERVRSRKSISTLNAVKQKLKRHLSRESTLAKRRSVSSVGTTEEEVGRRAELRRIRHKRIQDELSNEASYDEDARSLSSIADGDTTLGTTINASWVPGDPLPLPHLLSPSLSYPAFPFPDLAPVEEHDDSDDDVHESWEVDQATNKSEPATTRRAVNGSKGSISRRHSPLVLNEGETAALDPKTSQSRNKESGIPALPPAPTLEAKKLPSIHEPPTSSWRLSFISQNRGEHLRKLSQEHQMPIPVTLEESDKCQQPVLRRWLHGQGLLASSNVIAGLDNGNTTVESLVSESRSCPASHYVGGVDGGIEQDKTMVPLHQMGISHRLMSSGTLHPSSSSPQLASWGSHHRGGSSLSNATELIRTERGKYLRKTSESMALSEDIPKSWGKVLLDKRQCHSSAGNSTLASAESYSFNLATLLAGNRSKLSIQDMSNVSRLGTLLTTVTTASDGSPSRPIQRQVRRPTCDDNSFIISETESFREREVELSIVKARFASTEGSRCPSTPVSSKFREEFELEPEMNDPPIKRRPSKFSRLTKFATRQHDGPSVGMEELLSIPIPDFVPPEHAKKKKLADEALGGAWGEPSKQKKHRKKSKDSYEPKTVLGALGFMAGGHKKKKSTVDVDHKAAAAEYKEQFDDRVHTKELVMDSWEDEMAAIAKKAKVKSKNIVKKKVLAGPDLRYPPNWARFPSHNRQERSTSAGRRDNIAAKDFAMKSAGNGEPTWYHHERKYHLYHYEGDDHPSHGDSARRKGVIEKAHKILKEHVYEYRNRGEPPEIEDSYGRRSSMNVPLETDFPELEILPMEIRTAAQMEQEVVAAMEEQKRLQDLADTDMGGVDGSLDSGHTFEMVGGISIADPKFYEDCLVTSAKQLSPQQLKFSPGMHFFPERKRGRKGKYQTWSGKNWDSFRSMSSMGSGCGSGRRRRRELTLRKSTEDYHNQLKELEKAEREKVLGLAKEVWGRKKEHSGEFQSDVTDKNDGVVVTAGEVSEESEENANGDIVQGEVVDNVELLG